MCGCTDRYDSEADEQTRGYQGDGTLASISSVAALRQDTMTISAVQTGLSKGVTVFPMRGWAILTQDKHVVDWVHSGVGSIGPPQIVGGGHMQKMTVTRLASNQHASFKLYTCVLRNLGSTPLLPTQYWSQPARPTSIVLIRGTRPGRRRVDVISAHRLCDLLRRPSSNGRGSSGTFTYAQSGEGHRFSWLPREIGNDRVFPTNWHLA